MTDTATELTAQQRLEAAVNAEDETYIESFKAGVEISETDGDLAADADQATKDGYELNEERKASPNRNKLLFSPHPMGGIGVTLYGSDGTINQGRLELDAASLANTMLTALLGMMIQTSYFLQQQAAQQASGLIIPGRS